VHVPGPAPNPSGPPSSWQSLTSPSTLRLHSLWPSGTADPSAPVQRLGRHTCIVKKRPLSKRKTLEADDHQLLQEALKIPRSSTHQDRRDNLQLTYSCQIILSVYPFNMRFDATFNKHLHRLRSKRQKAVWFTSVSESL